MSEYVHQETESRFRLTGDVNVDTVADYRDSLKALILASSANEIELDLDQVESQGSAVIALLISLERESRFLDKRVIYQNCSVDLQAVAAACGVQEILHIG